MKKSALALSVCLMCCSITNQTAGMQNDHKANIRQALSSILAASKNPETNQELTQKLSYVIQHTIEHDHVSLYDYPNTPIFNLTEIERIYYDLLLSYNHLKWEIENLGTFYPISEPKTPQKTSARMKEVEESLATSNFFVEQCKKVIESTYEEICALEKWRRIMNNKLKNNAEESILTEAKNLVQIDQINLSK